jgi:hypothetical protein
MVSGTLGRSSPDTVLPPRIYTTGYGVGSALDNAALIYNLLFTTASQTLLTVGRTYTPLRAETGFIAVLHTWSQLLSLHVHLHVLWIGGGLALDALAVARRPGSPPWLWRFAVLRVEVCIGRISSCGGVMGICSRRPLTPGFKAGTKTWVLRGAGDARARKRSDAAEAGEAPVTSRVCQWWP